MEDQDLERFLALVPAAAEHHEEFEIIAEVAAERHREVEEFGVAWLAWPASRPLVWDVWSGASTDDEDDVGEPLDVGDEEPSVTRAQELQALALLQRVLGAEPLP